MVRQKLPVDPPILESRAAHGSSYAAGWFRSLSSEGVIEVILTSVNGVKDKSPEIIPATDRLAADWATGCFDDFGHTGREMQRRVQQRRQRILPDHPQLPPR